MKNLILVLLLLISINTLSQNLNDFSVYVEMIKEQKIQEKEILDLLINKKLILESKNSEEHANLSFMVAKRNYKNINQLCGEILRKHISSTEFQSMDKEVFVCKEVFLSEGIYCQGATVMLLNNETRGSFYYLYQPNWKFPFSIQDEISIPDKFLCNTISKEYDKFSNSTKYHTNPKGFGDDGRTDNITFHRIDKDDTSRYYMRIRKFGSNPGSGEGVTILFKDGTRITKDVQTEVQVVQHFLTKESNYEHHAFIELTQQEIKVLAEKDMDAIKIFIYIEEILTPWKYKAYIKCLLNAKN
ncbi:MAG: hypothetical protein JXC36_06280 [Candidatus Atribacteria bacterium]|nr:hypothetical protein [Candidatus Atribacteria bacterium]MBN2747668.1 hypothetical protein [Bacteroidales bacterium]